jgi:two-component system, sensor histidine kinase LadS
MADPPHQPKDDVAAAIHDAQANLEYALAHLARLPAFDPMALGVATHALTNYLTVMYAGVQLLRRAWQTRDETQVQSLLQGVEHATDLMRNVVAQLRGVAKAGPPMLLHRPVDLVFLAQQACDYYQPLAARKQLHLLCEAAVEPRVLETDPIALAAVLDNLLSNAVKFSPPGRCIWLVVERQAGHVIWRVRDEGPGVSAAEQAQLFQGGVRLSPQPTAGEPSSGYGLAVAKQLVEQLGGTIWCESQAGQGATFVVSLPG